MTTRRRKFQPLSQALNFFDTRRRKRKATKASPLIRAIQKTMDWSDKERLVLLPRGALRILLPSLLLAALLLPARAQTYQALPDAPSSTARPAPHRFTDKKNLAIFAGAGVAVTFDALGTQKCLSRPTCREGDPLARPFVGSRRGQALVSAAGYSALIGGMYLLHRTNHHKLERLLGLATIGAEGVFAAHTYRIVPAIPKPPKPSGKCGGLPECNPPGPVQP
jgi:hypothetical protein